MNIINGPITTADLETIASGRPCDRATAADLAREVLTLTAKLTAAESERDVMAEALGEIVLNRLDYERCNELARAALDGTLGIPVRTAEEAMRNRAELAEQRAADLARRTWVQCTTTGNECLGGCASMREHDRYRHVQLTSDAADLARRLAAVEGEADRLRNVIRTGGAMYRAERAVMGIPGGIDPEPVASPAPAPTSTPGATCGDAPDGVWRKGEPAPDAGEAARELRVVLEPLYRQLARIQSITMPGVHAELAACNKRIQSTIEECVLRREAAIRTERDAAHRAEVEALTKNVGELEMQIVDIADGSKAAIAEWKAEVAEAEARAYERAATHVEMLAGYADERGAHERANVMREMAGRIRALGAK